MFPPLILLSLIWCVDGCTLCQWSPWEAWGSCWSSCGGGSQSRSRGNCGHAGDTYQQTLDKCGKAADEDYERRACNEHCYNGGVYTGVSCVCPKAYYDSCCNSKCPDIDHCIDERCTYLGNNVCDECEDNNVFFKKTNGDRSCDRKCAWNNHYCWPGQCTDELTQNCMCASGFERVSTNTETSCQLQASNTPTIDTCDMIVVAANGEKKRALQSHSSSECRYKTDVFGNFQATRIEYDYLASFSVDSQYFPTQPQYVDESHFGVTDASVAVTKRPQSGPSDIVGSRPILTDTNGNGASAKTTVSKDDNITVSTHLSNGDRLCLTYTAMGGGYLKYKDMRTHTLSGEIAYRKNTVNKELCYKFDDSPCMHCQESGACTYEPLQLVTRTVRSPIITVGFDGWFDPSPAGGTDSQASGVDTFDITVNEVHGTETVLMVGDQVSDVTLDAAVTSTELNLTSDVPKLYCITLTVKDVADNVKLSRRFVLYDNTSYIEPREDKPFYVASASVYTGYVWQTHHNDVCLNWTGHFYNKFYFNNPRLSPIEPDRSGLISGTYEQVSGVLPVSGTPNVHGIIEYQLSWNVNGGTQSSEEQVQNFQEQHICKRLPLADGETYVLKIKAVDIMANSYSENRTVHIDRSVPHINDIWLTKDGYKRLYVHDRTDLSRMELQFSALDPHSGIRLVGWEFGTSDDGRELDRGSLAVITTNQTACAAMSTHCYCPDVGVCELDNYSVKLNSLVAKNLHTGNHNRHYYFTITVTNHARLSTTEHVDVLVDDSPPAMGVVFEGDMDSLDIDYTSGSSLLVHWHGFIDHESGIMLYRLGLADRCLHTMELYNYDFTSSHDDVLAWEVSATGNSQRIPTNFTGKRFVSVVALNSAMDPSEAVCSDGITRDTTPPILFNLTLQHARWSDSVVCHRNRTWLLTSELHKILQPDTPSCRQICLNVSSSDTVAELLPESIERSKVPVANYICGDVSRYSPETLIYMPDDHVFIQWAVQDNGQIQDFYVGFGTDPTETSAPSLLDYVSTGKKQEFKRRHDGINSDMIFYIFIRAVNKAGLDAVAILGPVVIDETPPLYTDIPSVNVVDSNIVLGWESGTFYDFEQEEQINLVKMQIDHGATHMSPLLEWRLGVSASCADYTGGCFLYQLARLQRQDTDLGLTFHAVLYIYNKAGHVTVVETTAFWVPSRYPPGHFQAVKPGFEINLQKHTFFDSTYTFTISFSHIVVLGLFTPPGHGVVYDMDPAESADTAPDTAQDTAVHFTRHTVCARWSGFHHLAEVTLEAGVGSTAGQDDVLTFRAINNSNLACVYDTAIPSDTTLFFSVRATGTGGQTVSSSNGVTIYYEDLIMQSMIVRIGLADDELVIMANISGSNNSTSRSLSFPGILTVGRQYCMAIGMDITDYSVRLTSNELYIGRSTLESHIQVFSIRPFVPRPAFTITGNWENDEIQANITIRDCVNQNKYQSDTHKLDIHWRSVDYVDNMDADFRFEAAATVNHCPEHTTPCLEFMTPFESAGDGRSATITGLRLRPPVTYQAAVRPCTSTRCLGYTLSDTILVETVAPVGGIQHARMDAGRRRTSCHTVVVKWAAFYSESAIGLYQWSVAGDDGAARLLTTWQSVSPLPNNTNDAYHITDCVHLPIHPHGRTFACVRAYSEAGHVTTVCKATSQMSGQDNFYDKHTVYDFDANSQSWQEIKNVLHSSVLGDKLAQLHDSELDFGLQDVPIAGAIIYANEREITWYLTMSQIMPESCDTDSACITMSTTTTGYVEFAPSLIQHNTANYICAYSEVTSVERELFTETLEELSACSDGFVIDTLPPSAGHVHVGSHNGYLVDTRAVGVTWDGFSDNVDVAALGYTNPIYKYSVYIGTYADRDDILQHTDDIGASSHIVVRNLSAADGARVFIGVTATDHAGHTTTATTGELIVDTTPPVAGYIDLESDRGMGQYVGSDSVGIYLRDFHDEESGIDKFTVGVGSQCDMVDIVPRRMYGTDHMVLPLDSNQLHDGHSYCIIVMATNRAGLSSTLVTQPFVLDRSAPQGGHVMDGHWTGGNTDVDYQPDTRHVIAHWKGFSDPHSGIYYYRAGLGTSRHTANVKPMADVGLSTDVEWHSSIIPGVVYHVTVEACNWAGRCRAVSSNGVLLDNSAPSPGLVWVGSGTGDQRYVPHSSSLRIEWLGFEDPQSGVDHYDVCISMSSPGSCDILSYFNCLLSTTIIKTQLHLPTNTDLYATVTATNKAGENVSRASDIFRVDTSPPVVITRPTFVTDISSEKALSFQWERSVLRAAWLFADDESPIVRQVVTLTTDHEGHTPIEHVELGAQTNLTLNLGAKQWLHNGDVYRLSVTVCNAAGLCVDSVSDELLVDSTPPHQGGLTTPLTWYNWMDDNGETRSTVNISWYGFTDQESGIAVYYITVSRTYNGNELSNGTFTVPIVNTPDTVGGSFNLTEYISPDDQLVISMWAGNKAGLQSSVSRVTVTTLATSSSSEDATDIAGFFEIEKHSCDVHYCNKDCTCAVVGKPCVEVRSNVSCLEMADSDVVLAGYPSVDVFPGLADRPHTASPNITASSACLSGYWRPTDSKSDPVIYRYEWSIGIVGQPYGEGIFDLKNEMPWKDVGLRTDVIHCLPVNRSLVHGERYAVYVRPWYGFSQYAVYSSAAVLVDHTAPAVRRGAGIMDSDGTCEEDVSFIDWTDSITACWYRVFKDSQSGIMYYTVALGTSVKADDVYPVTRVDLDTRHTITDLALTHGTRYYCTVTAYNNVGLHTTLSSDGFVVDTDYPLLGVVFNTDQHRDEPYQASSTTLSLSWHGFVDHYSGIRAYMAAVVEEGVDDGNTSFINVGINTHATFRRMELGHGRTYRGLVKAVDAAGHVSNVSMSRDVTIDTTPPQGFICSQFGVIQNQTTVLSDHVNVMEITHDFVKDKLYKLSGEMSNNHLGTEIRFIRNRFAVVLPTVANHNGTMTFEYNFTSPLTDRYGIQLDVRSAYNATVSVTLSECDVMETGTPFAVHVQQIGTSRVAVNVHVHDVESGIYQVLLGAGTTVGGFQARALSPVRGGGRGGVLPVRLPHGSPVYVTAVAENLAGLRSTFQADPIFLDHTPPAINNLDVQVQTTNVTTNVTDHVLLVVTWDVSDEESRVEYCTCEIDVFPGRSSFVHTNSTACLTSAIAARHGDRLSVSVTCVNNAQIGRTISLPVVISTQKPTSGGAYVKFTPTDIFSRHADTPLTIGPENMQFQSNGSSVHICWSGFTDVSGLHHYEYRLLRNNETWLDWVSTDLRTQALVTGLDIPHGSALTAHVRAVNTGYHVSDYVTADVMVDGRRPYLSGEPVTVETVGNTVRLIWDGVFSVAGVLPITYAVTVGSQPGFTNLADIPYTAASSHSVIIPEYSILTPDIHELHVTISCAYPTTLSAKYTAVIKL